jgi:hypothetical protein
MLQLGAWGPDVERPGRVEHMLLTAAGRMHLPLTAHVDETPLTGSCNIAGPPRTGPAAYCATGGSSLLTM